MTPDPDFDRILQQEYAKVKAEQDAKPTEVALPKICVTNRQLRSTAADALAALQSVNDPPFLFARGQTMVAVFTDEKQRYVIGEVTESALRGWMTRSANYFRINAKGDMVDIPPPIDVVRDVLALPPSQ